MHNNRYRARTPFSVMPILLELTGGAVVKTHEAVPVCNFCENIEISSKHLLPVFGS